MSEDLTQPLPNDGVQLILRSLDILNGRMTGLENRMTGLEDKVDRRLQETRPIWEQVLGRLDRIEARLDSIETRLDKIEARLDKVESEVYSLNRKFRVFTEDMLKVQDKQEDLEERVAKLEPESTP